MSPVFTQDVIKTTSRQRRHSKRYVYFCDYPQWFPIPYIPVLPVVNPRCARIEHNDQLHTALGLFLLAAAGTATGKGALKTMSGSEVESEKLLTLTRARTHYQYRPPNGEIVFVTDYAANCVQVYRVSDGTHVCTLNLASVCAGVLFPHRTCLSPCGERLFVSEHGNNCIQVIRASDGDHILTIGTEGSDTGQFECPRHVCMSPSGEWLPVIIGGAI